MNANGRKLLALSSRQVILVSTLLLHISEERCLNIHAVRASNLIFKDSFQEYPFNN
jgi:hypothetical protein